MNANLNELYFKWICSIIFPDERLRDNYMNVLRVLNNTTFEYILALDENRQKDGVDLHYHFSYACKIPYDIIQINFDNTKCSVLEMMTALAKRCEKAGVKKLSMHDLRHTMATRFTEQSTDYKRLSKMLGHSSIKITVDTYVHETQDSIDVATDKFSNYLDELFD